MGKETQLPAAAKIITPDEVKIMQLALTQMIEDLEDQMKMPQVAQYNKEARGHMADLLKISKSALLKVGEASGALLRFAPYKPGDEKEFLV